MKHLSPVTFLKGFAALALLVGSCIAAAAQRAGSQKISDLFTEIKAHATYADDDAQRLEAYTRSNMGWRSHGNQLRLIKEHVNELLRDYNEAVQLREEGTPGQQQIIDQLRPVLKGMADHLTATIECQNESPTSVKFEPYAEYVRGNGEFASKASTLIHDLIDHGTAGATADWMETELGFPAPQWAPR